MWEAAPCMACCTPRWGTCCSGLIPTIPTRAAYAPITTDVWRDWPQVRPSARASGGGVMQRAALFPMVRAETLRLLGGYVQSPAVLEHIDEYIVAPALFPVSGLVGSYLIGKRALEERG